MKPKRKISIFLPMKKKADTLFVFLQKRSLTAKVLPGYYGFWGGGAEGDESPEEALIREVQEELGLKISISDVRLLNHYEFLSSIKDVYLLESEDGFEETIVIGEGDYGTWFPLEEVFERKDMIFEDKVVLSDVERVLKGAFIR